MNRYYYALWEDAGCPVDEYGIAIVPNERLLHQAQSKKGEKNGISKIRSYSRTNRTSATQSTVQATPDQQITQTTKERFPKR